jgi:hypothetical protein
LTNHRTRCRRGWLVAACLCGAAGCHGSGRIEIASLNYRTIDPPAPQHTPIDFHECYWWTDADGRVWIAMQREQAALFNPKLRFQFQLSLVLEKLPAGPALNYKVTRNTLRARVHFGPWQSRFTSQVGVVAVYRAPHDRLRGSVRLQAARVTTEWLGGWSRPTRYLMLGSFLAVPDERRGRPIAEATESQGWGREPRAPAPPAAGPSAPAAIAETEPS